jgi:hypothetical protein
VDVGWLVSAVAASSTYLLVSRRFNPADENLAVSTSRRALSQAPAVAP